MTIKRIALFLAVIGFMCWIVLAEYLRELYNKDLDSFWMTIATVGIVVTVSLFFSEVRLREQERDREQLK
jgi:Na+/melibiose symporter-like transporter